MPTKEPDVLGLKTNVFQEVEGLLESGGKEIAPLRRQRAHEKFEAGVGAEAVLKIGRGHGELVKVREQGRTAKGFGHEEVCGEIIEDRGCGNNVSIPSCFPHTQESGSSRTVSYGA
jgi:hypothetical protein